MTLKEWHEALGEALEKGLVDKNAETTAVVETGLSDFNDFYQGDKHGVLNSTMVVRIKLEKLVGPNVDKNPKNKKKKKETA